MISKMLLNYKVFILRQEISYHITTYLASCVCVDFFLLFIIYETVLLNLVLG